MAYSTQGEKKINVIVRRVQVTMVRAVRNRRRSDCILYIFGAATCASLAYLEFQRLRTVHIRSSNDTLIYISGAVKGAYFTYSQF